MPFCPSYCVLHVVVYFSPPARAFLEVVGVVGILDRNGFLFGRDRSSLPEYSLVNERLLGEFISTAQRSQQSLATKNVRHSLHDDQHVYALWILTTMESVDGHEEEW